MGLVEELCTWVGIHLSQLASVTIRLLICVDRLNEKHNLEFSAKYFFYSYFVKHKKPDTGHFLLNVRPHERILVLGFSSNKRCWKDKYFFVKGATRLTKGLSYPLCWRDSCSLILLELIILPLKLYIFFGRTDIFFILL